MSADYPALQRAAVCAALDDADLLARLRETGALPAGYGQGLDERVVELPWVWAQGLRGRCLDAGSALNHRHLAERAIRTADGLMTVTSQPEGQPGAELGVSYVYADLRRLPFADDSFETVACVSTLEHVGMDNSAYGDPTPRAADPEGEAARALRELARVVAPGGRILLTVPFGSPDDHGWFRQFDREGLERLVAQVRDRALVEIYAYGAAGWARSSAEQAAGARYRDPNELEPGDGAVAARAVACVRLSF